MTTFLHLSRDTQFFDGPPPHAGWYVTQEHDAARAKLPDFNGMRWWDGKNWGPWFHRNHTPEQVAFHFARSRRPKPGAKYKWALIWPLDARVARVHPLTGRVTGAGPCPYRTAGLPSPF